LRIEIHAGRRVLNNSPFSIFHSQFLGHRGGFCQSGSCEGGLDGQVRDFVESDRKSATSALRKVNNRPMLPNRTNKITLR